MRILMLSWEYPPKIVGGIARHVEEIAWALAAQGDEVHVVTCEFPGAPAEETYRGVHVHRVAPYTPTDNFVHWVHQLNAAMHDRAEALLREWTAGPKPLKSLPERQHIILHAHDWLAQFSSVALKHRFRVPLVATIHATELGRNSGIHTDGQRYIHSVEWSLTYEAWRVIVCSAFMRDEVTYAFSTPDDKVDVIPNGVHADKFAFDFTPEEAAKFRAAYAAPEERIVLFVGRMVREKGAHLLVEALPKVRAQCHGVKLVIAGGGYRAHLEDLARSLGMERHVYFTGFIPDDALLRLYKVVDVACYPSLYEPFGIVALEAMAAGVPVVVSDAGGLREIVEHDVTGTVSWLNNSDSLAWAIVRVLRRPELANAMARDASLRVREVFNWDRIAARTRGVYARVWEEYCRSDW
ncbi:MAG TPA: glycosyltransferase family 4 protein [Chthonomonadales bacterium]|nr:glycosyltransferase family 4 protein [Chthonomonadales bacterium]